MPVFDAAVDGFAGHTRPNAFLPDQQTLEHQLVDSLPQSVAGYLKLGRHGNLVGKHLTVLVFFLGDELAQVFFRLQVKGFLALTIDFHGKITKNQYKYNEYLSLL